MYKSEMILEFNKIKEMLCEHAVSETARQQLSQLEPFLKEQECRMKMEETTGARKILDSVGNPPISTMKEIEKIIILCEKEAMLSPEQLEQVAVFAASCMRMKNYLKKAEVQKIDIAYYGQSICDLSLLQDEINASIQNTVVLNSASTELRSIRRKIETIDMQVKRKLDDLLRSKKNYFAESYVSQRNGHYVVPVKREYKNQISGTVIETSRTGGTYFIEPSVVSKLQAEKNILSIEEENEIRKILYTLTVSVLDYMAEIRMNIEAMTTLDVIFAKAKLSAQMKAIPVVIDTNRTIEIKQGRHPLIRQENCVPLDFSIGNNIKGIIITGPNTGGKTVSLKTVGLLSIMAQCGLHVPVEKGKFCMNNLYLCDIGDGQSITENLSTFSAHITNIINILQTATQDSLVLLDELGSGTDPAEGMGIAIAILEELRQKKCLFVATTHYPEVKEYAMRTESILNARMAFDRESLKPLYQLEIGEAGESCALYIAKRLGFPKHMLELAYKQAYTTDHDTKKIEFSIEKSETVDIQKVSNTAVPQILKEEKRKIKNEKADTFEIGDSVMIYPEKNLGIVYEKINEKGQIGVQIKGEKFYINHKRIKLKTAASELYPPDYDMSIIFDTVENRKARHQMERKYTPNLTIQVKEN